MFQTKDVDKIKTHFIFNNFFFNCTVPEIMWKNTAEPAGHRWQRSACAFWIPKATYKHSEYSILLLFHYNNVCTNAPRCYVILTVHVSFIIIYYSSLTKPRLGCTQWWCFACR